MFAIRYFVKDVDEAIDFYSKALGFGLIEQYGPAMAIMRKENLELWLAGPQSSAAKAYADDGISPSGGDNRIVLITDNIENISESLELYIRIPVRRGPVGRQLVVQDPSGNFIEIFEQTKRP